MWYSKSVFYQIYPLGFTKSPWINDGQLKPRIKELAKWFDHFQRLGINAIYFNPIFESDSHGYDTTDYQKIDCRLGSNQDFQEICQKLHQKQIKIVLDAVFNHVGRGFWAFQDLLVNREKSAYKDWFYLDFNGDSPYHDGFYYQGWEGHYELVKLNLTNPDLVNYLLASIKKWILDFDIDGLRLDVAYCLDREFLKQVAAFTKELKQDFFLVGEIIHGDYNQLVNDTMLDSCTNYECFKGIYSSLNDKNLFEIAYSLNRQFGSDDWALYRNKHLFNFIDNHDVARIASNLKNPEHLKLAFGLLFTIPGIPCIYYGSEWASQGLKETENDYGLRPYFAKPQWNSLTDLIAQIIQIKKDNPALNYGDYQQLFLTNSQFVFQRKYENNTLIIAINLDEFEFQINNKRHLVNLFTHKPNNSSVLTLPGYSIIIYKEL